MGLGNLLGRHNETNDDLESRWYLTDPLGSIAWLSIGTGNLGPGNYRYSPDGVPLAGVPINFGYRSAHMMPGGLTHFGYRYYDPNQGMWTQQDPVSQILDPNQANRYLYAGGNPVNSVDPSGLCLDPPGLGGTPGQGTVPCGPNAKAGPGDSAGFDCNASLTPGVCGAIGPVTTGVKIILCGVALVRSWDATKCNSF